MKLKKLLALGLATVMTTGLLAGCSSGSDSDKGKDSGEKVFKIAMVTDVGGVNDQSFNQSSWEGLEKIRDQYGEDKVQVKYLESKQESDYVPHLESLVEEEQDLIIGVGYKLKPAIEEASKNYPEQEFALIDDAFEKQPKNVTSLAYADHVSSYLTGLIAGKMTETGKVGFIGGAESVVISRFEYGFRAGVLDARKDAKVSVQYANAYDKPQLGKSIAQQMHSNGVDIIFTAAGDTGTGAIEAAKENNKKAIGVDRDQNDLAPDNIITSAMKNIDVSVYNLVETLIKGEYKGGQVINNTLENDGVGIAPTSDKNVPPDVLAFVKEESEKIKKGEIKIPQNKEEFEEKYGK